MIGGVALAATDAEILRGLQKSRCASEFGEFRAQTIDDRGGADAAIRKRFEVDEHEAGIAGAATGTTLAAGEGGDVLDSGIGHDDSFVVDDGVNHGVKRSVLRALDAALQIASVLQREEAFGDAADEDDVEGEGDEQNDDDERGMTERPDKGAAIAGEQEVKAAFAGAIDSAMFGFAMRAQDA